MENHPVEIKTELALKIKQISKEDIFFRRTLGQSYEYSIIKSIKSKINHNNLILTKADKGQTITIIKKSEYIKKMNEFISLSEAEVLKSNPTDKFQKNIINTLNTFIEKLPNKPNIYHLRLMKPQPPILYGLSKLHKTN